MEKQISKQSLTMETLTQEPWWNTEMHSDDEYLETIEEQVSLQHTSLPHGYRNNNPGNIRLGTTHWQGLCKTQKDGEFCQFRTLKWGFRAMLVQLATLYGKHHLRTLLDIYRNWAPSTEGNTPDAKAKRVSGLVSRTIKEPLPHPQGDKILWVDILLAMAEVENGTNRYYPRGYLRACANEAWNDLFNS